MGSKAKSDGVGIFVAEKWVDMLLVYKGARARAHTHTHTFCGPFFLDYPGELVPER